MFWVCVSGAVMISKSIAIVGVMLWALLLNTGLQAQEGHPDGEMIEFTDEEEAQMQADARALDADLTSRSIFHYTIAYLISDVAAIEDEVFSEAVMTELTGATPFYTFDALEEAHTEAPFEIVILHHSMLAAVDQVWAQDAFESGVIFAGLDISVGEQAVLFGKACFKDRDLKGQVLPDWRWINAISYRVNVQNPADYERVRTALFEMCHAPKDVADASAGYNIVTLPLVKPSYIDTLPQILIARTHEYGLPNRSETYDAAN